MRIEATLAQASGQALNPRAALIVGAAALLISLVLAFIYDDPKPFQKAVFAVFIGLGGASFTTGMAGLLEIRTKWLTAGGPLAVFIFIVWVVTQVPLTH